MMRWRAARFALGLAASVLASATFAAPAAAQRGGRGGEPNREDLLLTLGETKTIPAAPIKEFAVGAGNFIEVSTTAEKLTIRPVKVGATTLTIFRHDGSQVVYQITITQRPPDTVKKEVDDLLQSVAGSLKTRVVGGRILIEGNVPSEGERRRLDQIAAPYNGQVELIVTIGVQERKLLIRLDFFFIQYEKTFGYNVGIWWPPTIGADARGIGIVQSSYTYDFISRTTTAAQASVVNQPLPRLDIAARYGWAKVMKQSSVITANGSEATFQNGGEQNFLQNVGLSVGLVNVRYGTNVTVLPRYDSSTRDVEIKLNADVADLTSPTSANGPPGRTTTRLDTQVTLKLGQALVLSGIKTASQRRTHTGIPGLSDIPVLGLLFGTHGQEKQELEGAVFIVPSVVDTVPKSALELINNAMATYKDYTGEIDYVDTFQRQPPSAK